MGKGIKLCALLLGCGLVFGCASANNPTPVEQQAVAELDVQPAEPIQNDASTGQRLLKTAHSAIGTPYVLGGTTPRGFDCSGFVRWAYDSIGVHLPRTAREQSVVGEKITRIEDMQAGDIVAFRHPKRGFHTGIYVGDGKFIHSPRQRTRVRINSLSDSYFASTLLGARRVNMSGSDDLVVQAQCRLDEYAQQRKQATSLAAKGPARTASGKSKATAAKSKAPARAVASKGRSAHKSVASASKKTTRSVVNAKKSSKTVASKGKAVASKATAKTVASAKSRTKLTAQAASKVGKKPTAAKKSPARAVSMLNKNSSGSAVRKRNHS